MELKLFTDLIDAVGKGSSALKAIVNLPKAERETIRRTPDETYRLIETKLNTVIIRLRDILVPKLRRRLPCSKPPGWTTATIGNALLLELQTFPRAVEVAQATTKPEEAKGWMGRWLGRASTVSGSVKDLMETLPPYAKNALTLFKELIDLFKGKD